MGLDQVRAYCMALPTATERPSHGEPAWFVNDKKLFAMFADEHHDNRVALWLAAAPGIQEALVQEDPRRYFRPPYVGVRGWVGVYLDIEDVDWETLNDLIREGFRHVAPDKIAKMLD